MRLLAAVSLAWLVACARTPPPALPAAAVASAPPAAAAAPPLPDDPPPDPAEGGEDREVEAPPTSDPKLRAQALYLRASKNYGLGKFHRAALLFRLAYVELREPAFLFNVAQAYRQLGNCAQEAYFYRRFLRGKRLVADALRAQIEGYIAACAPPLP